MYELKKVGERTWYMSAPTNIGFYLHNAPEVCMIDAGGDREAAEKALEHIRAQGWRLTGLFLTHSHADHTGGAAFIHEQTSCRVFAPGISAAVVKHSFLLPTTLYGGCPNTEMCNKFLFPPACDCAELTEQALPAGLHAVRLDGHDMAQTAYKTSDGVCFTADCVVSSFALSKHRISFIYSVGHHFEALETLYRLDGSLFIPSHDIPCIDIKPLVQINRDAVHEVARDILEMCSQPLTIDEIISRALEKYSIRLYLMQYLLVGQTVRSYISWLQEKGDIVPVFDGTKLLFVRSDNKAHDS